MSSTFKDGKPLKLPLLAITLVLLDSDPPSLHVAVKFVVSRSIPGWGESGLWMIPLSETECLLLGFLGWSEEIPFSHPQRPLSLRSSPLRPSYTEALNLPSCTPLLS